mmetsp:Transcript_38725/g.98274  ORF Transcript_38725/g.98274 Transcript_38725/m.98274 type:complete len:367 (-) Transcript_38725:1301-2401(-)
MPRVPHSSTPRTKNDRNNLPSSSLRGVLDVHAFLCVDLIDQLRIGILDNLALELLRGRELAGLLREVGGQDRELLDLEGVVGATLAGAVRSLDRVGDGFDPHLVIHRCADRLDLRVQPLGARLQNVRARHLAIGAHGLQRDQGHVVLALVANHHHFRDAVASLLDRVLDGHRRNVLAALADDQLLVAACDLHHAVHGNHALVARMQPTVGIDRLGGLPPDLGDVLLAEVGASQVAHHDVAAAEAQLALVLLVDVGERAGALHLGLRVEVLFIDLEGPDLDARHLRAAGAPLVHLVRGHGAGAGALRHAVDLVDGEAQRAEVLEGVDADGRRTREAELALVQPQTCLHLGQNRIGRRKAPRHSAAAT